MNAKAVPVRSIDPDTAAEAISYIVDNLRQADLDEIRATTTEDPHEVLTQAVEWSANAHFILDRTGLPIGIFGVAPSGTDGVGLVWMVGTDGIAREGVSIARQTARYVALMHEDFPILTNFIDARNEASLSWLLRAGFHLIDAKSDYGPEQRLFFQFSRTA